MQSIVWPCVPAQIPFFTLDDRSFPYTAFLHVPAPDFLIAAWREVQPAPLPGVCDCKVALARATSLLHLSRG
jgi:hypothetical protein